MDVQRTTARESEGLGGLEPVRLNDGTVLPAVGFGTAGLTGTTGINVIAAAITDGYRLLDSADGYGNEAEVGEAVRRSGRTADTVLVTTKVNGHGHGYDEARRSIEESRHRLRVDRIDLQLIHWPTPSLGRYVDTWRALVAARADGEVRTIGVSNFTQKYLEPIIDATGVIPAVNQIELHPHFPQLELQEFNRSLGIITQAWSPLGRGVELFRLPQISEAARAHGVTPAQVVLRWAHQLGAIPLPRSSSPARRRQNLDLGGFALTVDEMQAIAALGERGGRLWGGDPDQIAFM